MSDEAKIARDFPELRLHVDFEISSPPTVKYNCLSWAVNINWAWYDPTPRCAGYYWMPGHGREWTLENLRKLLAIYGYREEVASADFEPGIVKLAIYVDDDGLPSHFARQLPSGLWASKLGALNDIEHNTLDSLVSVYGRIAVLLKHSMLGVAAKT